MKFQTRLKKARKFIYLVGLVVGLALLLIQVWKGYDAVRLNALSIVSYEYLGLAIFFISVALAAQMLAWTLLMHSMGGRLSWQEILSGYMISFLPRYLPGTIWGYWSRNEWLYREHGIAYQVSSWVSFAELSSSVISNVLIGSICLLGYLYGSFGYLFSLWLVIVIPIIAWWGMRLALGVAGTIFKGSFILPVYHLDKQACFYWLVSVYIFSLHWILMGLAVMSTCATFGIYRFNTLETILRFSAMYCGAWLGGAVFLGAPAGLGARETLLSFLLNNYLGLSAPWGSILSVAFRAILVFSELALVLMGFIFRHAPKKDVVLTKYS